MTENRMVVAGGHEWGKWESYYVKVLEMDGGDGYTTL